ncbi:hypothetical protein H4R33_005553 [Dimargaris cristalligena]|nr:hypothetical protein H4R33_005553 [Dimargaris cristalligena]
MKGRVFDHFIHYSRPDQPGLKRRSYACDNCRKKKIRCNGEQPACDNCTRKKLDCTYPVRRNRSSRNSPTTTHSTPTTPGAFATSPTSPQMPSPSPQRHHLSPHTLLTPSNPCHGARSCNTSGSLSTSLSPSPCLSSSTSSHLSASPASTPDRPAPLLGASASPSPSRPDYLTAPSVSSTSASPSLSRLSPTDSILSDHLTKIQEGMVHLMEMPKTLIVQSDIQVRHIIDYFEYVHPQIPMLHKWSFLQRLNQNQLPPVLLYSMYAVAARFSKRPQVVLHDGPTAGHRYLHLALDIIQRDQHHPTLDVFQAIVLCSVAAGVALDMESVAFLRDACATTMRNMETPIYQLHQVTPTYLASLSEAEGIALESLRRTVILATGLAIVAGIVYEKVEMQLHYPTSLIWTHDETLWEATTLDPATLTVPPRLASFAAGSFPALCSQISHLQSLFIKLERCKLIPVDSPYPMTYSRIMNVLLEDLTALRRGDQRVAELFSQSGPPHSDADRARCAGIQAILPLAECQVNRLILDIALPLNLTPAQIHSHEALLVDAADRMCRTVQRNANLLVEYTYTWIPHFVFMVARILQQSWVRSGLDPGLLTLMGQQHGVLTFYQDTYKNHWNTNFSVNFT